MFLDLPKHLEVLAGPLPLLTVGLIIGFDMEVLDPSRVGKGWKGWKVMGEYRVQRTLVKYSSAHGSRMGMSQYLELSPVEAGPP